MKWEEYIMEVLSEEECLNNIRITVDDKSTMIPDIIKSSVYLLEKMIQNQGQRNVFVFPEGKLTPFIFMLSKLIYNIGIGKIESSYDINSFVQGQKLKFGKCIMEFIKVDYEPKFKEDAVFLKFSDCTTISKKKLAPYFQTVDTKRPLSKYEKFRQEETRIENEEWKHNDVVNSLADLKTSMMKSLIYISSVSKSLDFVKELKIDEKELTDYFFMSQTDYTGKLKTLKGLYSGTPALIFSGNIAYANEAVHKGASIQSAIINLNDNDINQELSELDELIGFNVPILCVADTIHSFDLDELKNRGFNIWRWDEKSITPQMCNASNRIEEKSSNCKNQKTDFCLVNDSDISDAFRILYNYRRTVEDESAGFNTLYNKLFEIAYAFLHRVSFFERYEKEVITDRLDNCERLLENERNYINDDTFEEILSVIMLLKNIIKNTVYFPKMNSIKDSIIKDTVHKVCIVCANSDDTTKIREDWERILPGRIIRVMTVREFIKTPPVDLYHVYLCGWFGSKAMRQVLYGYDSSRIHVFLYKCEARWKNAHLRSWKNKLNNSENQVIAKKSFVSKKTGNDVGLKTTGIDSISPEEKQIIEEQDDLELVLQENKYRQYISNGLKQGGVEVDACPVSFAGGEFAMFTKGHKSLVVTKIIHQISNRIEEKETEELRVGDFVVIRETSKDIIRDVADKILELSGKEDIRERVSVWKDALKIEATFKSFEEIYKNLKECGCTRNKMTVRNWMNSDNIIVPMSKDDLICIAKATEDEILLEKLDEIFDDGTTIKRAHIKAGNVLSDRLTGCIADTLISDKLFDPYNIWEPIEMNIEEVGSVKIYKIIDISSRWIRVNSVDTNRLMDEEKEI